MTAAARSVAPAGRDLASALRSGAAGGLLQRRCAACGNRTPGAGACRSCEDRRRLKYQTKLTIAEAGDAFEQEADRVADRVLAVPPVPGRAGLRIQRRMATASSGKGTAPDSVDEALASTGAPLDAKLKRDMESRFGVDFSAVRTHTGSAAERSARDVDALAYTVGSHIVFGAGQFAPATAAGARLLAHELTHVVQQSGSDRPATDGSVPGSGLLRRYTTRGAGGCATSVTDEDEDDNGPKGAGRRAHDQIQTFLLPMLNEVQIPRASKRRIDDAGCQAEGSSPGFADLMRRSGILYDIGEIKPIGSAPTRGVLETEHYIRRAEQSADRLFGTGTCGSAGDDDRLFQTDIFRGRLRPTFGKLSGVLSDTTVIGAFIGDRTRTLKAKTVAPGAVGYWCTGGRSDTYTCGASPEETARYIDRVVGGPAQELLDQFIRDRIQQPLEAALRRQSLGDLIRLAERHFGTQIRQMLRPYLGPLADQVLGRASADQVAQLIDQAIGAEARAIVTTLVRLVTDAVVSELRTQLRQALTELVRSALVALCVGAPAVALSELLDRLQQELRLRARQLIPVVVTVVAARIVASILAELASMLSEMVAAIGRVLGVVLDIVLRVLAAVAIVLLCVGVVVAVVLGLVALVGSPGIPDEALFAGAAALMLGLIPALGRFIVSGSTDEEPEGA